MRGVPDDPPIIMDNPACVDGQRVKICKTNPVVEVIVDISHFLLAINSSANVIIYALRGNYFRLFMSIIENMNFQALSSHFHPPET